MHLLLHPLSSCLSAQLCLSRMVTLQLLSTLALGHLLVLSSSLVPVDRAWTLLSHPWQSNAPSAPSSPLVSGGKPNLLLPLTSLLCRIPSLTRRMWMRSMIVTGPSFCKERVASQSACGYEAFQCRGMETRCTGEIDTLIINGTWESYPLACWQASHFNALNLRTKFPRQWRIGALQGLPCGGRPCSNGLTSTS